MTSATAIETSPNHEIDGKEAGAAGPTWWGSKRSERGPGRSATWEQTSGNSACCRR